MHEPSSFYPQPQTGDGITRAPDGTLRYGVYVGKIDSTISVDALKQAFSVCGPVAEASINGSDVNPYRFGFIDFATEEARNKALTMNGYTLGRFTIKVNLPAARAERPPREPRPPRPMGGFGGAPAPVHVSMLAAPTPAPTQPDPAVLRNILLAMQSSGQLQAGAQPTPEQLQLIHTAAMTVTTQQWQQQEAQRAAAGGGFGHGAGGYGGGGGYPGGGSMFVAVNPKPTEEETQMKEVQKAQYFAVVRKLGEKYEKKMQSLMSRKKEGSGSSSSSSEADSSSSSESDDDNDAKNADDNANAPAPAAAAEETADNNNNDNSASSSSSSSSSSSEAGDDAGEKANVTLEEGEGDAKRLRTEGASGMEENNKEGTADNGLAQQ